MALHTDKQIADLNTEYLMEQEDAGAESFEQFNERYQGVMASRMAPKYQYNVHIFVEWETEEENRKARKAKPTHYAARNMRAVEALFEHNCKRVENNRLTNVRRLEVKQGQRVLRRAYFINGVRQNPPQSMA